ncbi:MAG: preprotein translocase subunit SecE [Candidatus Hydrogenedentota bacterium]|jgi:preprotein translocase subunit SecE|nr:MAG: preprotein translocase subunit SecE [Candidatus Hydrogenedentota bacterium]GIX44057.1 MAG: protein translocase subunit SecE [Candidatus Sumerlaea sp.]
MLENEKPKGRVRTFLEEVRAELRKVTWPTRRELYGATAVVITVAILLTVGIGALDSILGFLMQVLISFGV